MLYFNSCPRCKSGTVQLESDHYGSYLSCINCGFERSARSVRKMDYDEVKSEAALVGVVAGAAGVLAVDAEETDDLDEEFEDDFDADDDERIALERAAG
jgi:Zn ribbon nucleic-acid-binding protein